MKRGLLFPGLLTTAVLAMRCTGSDGGSHAGGGQAANAGEGGSGGSEVTAGTGGKGASGSAGSAATAGNAGSGSSVCAPGDTRTCVGPGNCEGGQVCRGDGSGWSACDCGAGAGGSGGEMTTGGTGNSSSGGEAGESRGGTGGASNEGGNGGDDGASGSGTSGEGGTGGTTGVGGTAGAGVSGSGGTAGSAGGLNCGGSVGLELVPSPGEGDTAWVDRDTNCLGIEGAVYHVEDGAGSDVYFTSRNGRICIAGHSEQVVGNDFATYWGVFVSIQLNNQNGNASPYDADENGVDGFEFTLSGDDLPPEIRPRYRVDGSGTEYCKQVCATGTQSLLLSDAHASCWNGTSGATPNRTNLTLLEFHIPSSASGDVTFDFCIDDIIAIKDDTNVGNPGTCGSGGAGGAGGTGGTSGGGTGGTSGGGTGGTSGGGNADSCVGRCGEPSGEENCYCDLQCEFNGDCCDDYYGECGSCAGNCDGTAPGGCSCESGCEDTDACCVDFDDECAPMAR
jgi:hypothetical protein